MGLDMYLEARKYVRKFEDYTSDNLSDDYMEIAKHFPAGADEFGDFAGAEVKITVGYWRKVNQIHNWFVKECADGVDECQPIRVGLDKLMELRAMVEETLEHKDKAVEYLPTASGFFFGGTEYDDYYWHGLERTKLILDKAISLDDDNYDFIYQASW
jgi:hypothetical protein